MSLTPVRGHVYRMNDEQAPLYCMAIAVLPAQADDPGFYGLRVTVTSARHDFPGWVRLNSGDPVGGYVCCHDLSWVELEELDQDLGPVSMETMLEIEKAVRRLFGM